MTEIQDLMNRAYRTLKSAELLFKDGDYNSAVSRAYYAMFYAAEAALFTKELEFSSHKSVISLFGQHFVKTGIFPKELGRQLSKAYKKRLNGDYEFAFYFKDKETKEIIEWAKKFVSDAKDYLIGEGFLTGENWGRVHF